jgi:extracellular factor (EF) 3-hydroxypalmitic acid methyl ester biosynthesis protein
MSMSQPTKDRQSQNGSHSGKPAAMPTGAVGTQATGVTFSTADGLKRHGEIVRVTPYSAFFEVHDRTLVLRLSEVLNDFEIRFHGQNTFRGRATVSGLVQSGFKTLCEAKLQEMNWSGEPLQSPTGMGLQFGKFLREWEQHRQIRTEFKNAAIEMLSFFNESNVWLNQVELGVRNLPPTDQARAEQEVLQQLSPHFIRATASINEKFEAELNQVEPEQKPLHQAFVRKFLHSATQSSPFMHRAFEKPLGYPGDYEVVDMMFRNPFEGNSYFAKQLNAYALQLPPVAAHRNRIEYLQKKLTDEALRLRAAGRPLTVFNLGCGPAREVQQFVAQTPLADNASFVLADFEEQSLAHVGAALRTLNARLNRRTLVKTTKVSVAQLIRQHERRGGRDSAQTYELVYCAGLFDYLTDSVCHHLMDVFYEMLAPGGLLVATNVDTHAAINQMECFLDWHLFYRNPERMRGIVPTRANPDEAVVKSDPTGVNMFLEIRKPAP